MRVTSHNGRTGKNGTYSAKHNDRQFNLSNAQHIDQSRTIDNLYWTFMGNKNFNFSPSEISFEGTEAAYYAHNLKRGLEARNQRYREQRHPERCKTMDEYRKAPKSCPEETILQIGNINNTIEPEVFLQICQEQLRWEKERFPSVIHLNAALHLDETTPHMHVRKIWLTQDADGNKIVSQSQALANMGIERPDPNKPQDRYNNPKMTYSEECRAHFEKLCMEHGLTIETEPINTSKKNLDVLAYKHQQEQNLLVNTRKQVRQQQKQLRRNQKKLQAQEQVLKKYEVDINNKCDELQDVLQELEKANNRLSRLQNKCNEKYEQLKELVYDVDESKKFLSSIKQEKFRQLQERFDRNSDEFEH